MKERDDSQPLSEFILIDYAYWGGKKQDGNRGRGATGKVPFLAAVTLSEEGNPVRMRMSRVKGFLKDEIALWGKKHLNPNSLVISDGLNCFPGVQEAACGNSNPHKRGV